MAQTSPHYSALGGQIDQHLRSTLIAQARGFGQEGMDSNEPKAALVASALAEILKTSFYLRELSSSPLSPNPASWSRPLELLMFYTLCEPGNPRAAQLRYVALSTSLPVSYRTSSSNYMLSLPRSSTNLEQPTMMAASAALITLVDFFSKDPRFDVMEEASIAPAWTPDYHLHILHWAAEHGEESSHNLMLDLVAAQYQRRALGLLDHYVFGAAGDKANLRVYAAWWDASSNTVSLCRFTASVSLNFAQISIKSFAKFDMSSPLDAVRFFLLLHWIAQQAQAIASDLEKLTVASVASAQEKYAGSWKAPAPIEMGAGLLDRQYSSEGTFSDADCAEIDDDYGPL